MKRFDEMAAEMSKAERGAPATRGDLARFAALLIRYIKSLEQRIQPTAEREAETAALGRQMMAGIANVALPCAGRRRLGHLPAQPGLPCKGTGAPVSPPPKGLSIEAQGWWKRLTAECILSEEAGLLLQIALEAFDRMRHCQEAIRRDGLIVLDRFGQRTSHPLLPAERDARAQMLSALNTLNLGPGSRPGQPEHAARTDSRA